MAIKAGDGEAALGVGKLYHKLWKNGGAYCGAAKYMLGEAAEKGYADLNIVHRETRGKVDLLIIRNDSEKIRKTLEPYHPILFDVLPLTLEEIFIYELGGEHYEIKDIIL